MNVYENTAVFECSMFNTLKVNWQTDHLVTSDVRVNRITINSTRRVSVRLHTD